MPDIKDILLKAAEDVQQGMWCKRAWFREIQDSVLDEDWDGRWAEYESASVVFEVADVEQMAAAHRCAEGSIVLAGRLLGATTKQADAAMQAVSDRIGCGIDSCKTLFEHNDRHLPDDPFEAGQQLAELFRTTAESL